MPSPLLSPSLLSLHLLIISTLKLIIKLITRTTFAEEWSHVSHPGGMVIFEHDLKNVTVAFQNREEGNIFKIEFPYKDIQDCVLVDTARPGAGKSTMFIPLRSVPRVLEAEGEAQSKQENIEFNNTKEQVDSLNLLRMKIKIITIPYR